MARRINKNKVIRKNNHIPITTETIAAAYEYLRTTPPFNKWNLPECDDITFKVANDPHHIGWHRVDGRGSKRKHLIAISSKCVGHTQSLMATVSHEAIHLYMASTGMDRGVGEHGAAFQKIAAKVCGIHGFDHKAF